MTSPPPPRLHVLLARKAPVGLVLRRGPSKVVCTIGWDLASDTFKVGQWMKAKVFPYRSDISPDGRHWIGFFSDYSPKRKDPAWTTIAPVPWLKALKYMPQDDSWFGGGIFVDRRTLWLNWGCPSSPPKTGDVPFKVTCEFPFSEMGNDGGECLNVYYKVLQLGGWRRGGVVDLPDGVTIPMKHEARSEYFIRPLGHGWELLKVAYATLSYRKSAKPVYFDEHFLVHRASSRIIEYRDWEWADFKDGRLLWAEGGCLHAARMSAEGPVEAHVLHDFNGMAFEERKAPY